MADNRPLYYGNAPFGNAREWVARQLERCSPIKLYLGDARPNTTLREHAEHVAFAILKLGEFWPCSACLGYYIGVSTRTPHEWCAMNTDIPHNTMYRAMVVLVQSSASVCRDVEIAAIEQHRHRDHFCRNRGRGGGGIARGTHDAFVYMCSGYVWQPAPRLRRR